MHVFSFSRWVTYQLVVSVCYLTTLYLSSRGKSQSDVILTLTPERWLHRTYLPIQLWPLERVFIYLHMFAFVHLAYRPLNYISYLLLWLLTWRLKTWHWLSLNSLSSSGLELVILQAQQPNELELQAYTCRPMYYFCLKSSTWTPFSSKRRNEQYSFSQRTAIGSPLFILCFIYLVCPMLVWELTTNSHVVYPRKTRCTKIQWHHMW